MSRKKVEGGLTDEQVAEIEQHRDETAARDYAAQPEDGDKPKRQRRYIPPELKPYYVIFGMPLDGRPAERVGCWKTYRRALNWIQESGEILRNLYESLEIVFCRRKDYTELR